MIKKGRGCFWWVGLITIIVVVVVVVVLVQAGKEVDKVVNAEHSIEYSVTGTGTASINWGTSSGQSSDNAARLPWTESAKATGFDGASIIAQRGSGSGSIACEIKIDGVSKTKQTATGPNAVVTCSAGT